MAVDKHNQVDAVDNVEGINLTNKVLSDASYHRAKIGSALTATFAKWLCDYVAENSLDIPEGFGHYVQ